MRKTARLWKWIVQIEGNMKIYHAIPDLIGMQSLTSDGKHVLFLDFDQRALKSVRNECRKIQKKYDLGNFYFFLSSKGNYHAICFDKLTFGKIADIQLELGMKKYLMFAAMRGFWVLRISPKSAPITYKGSMIGNSLIWDTSQAHYEFLHRLYLQMPKPQYLDGSKGLKVDVYTSVTKENKK